MASWVTVVLGAGGVLFVVVIGLDGFSRGVWGLKFVFVWGNLGFILSGKERSLCLGPVVLFLGFVCWVFFLWGSFCFWSGTFGGV